MVDAGTRAMRSAVSAELAGSGSGNRLPVEFVDIQGIACGERPIMSLVRVSVSLLGVAAMVGVTIAGATVWLLLTDPVTVVDAVNEGEVSPLVQALAGVLYDALRGLLRYL